MKKKLIVSKSISNVFALLALLLFVSGCAVHLMSDYDEQTDKSVTALQKKIDAFLVKLESEHDVSRCTYAKNSDFYSSVDVDVNSIVVRAGAMQKNEQTLAQLAELKAAISSLKTLHEMNGDRCMTREQVEPLRMQFNVIMTGILKLELAKKR